MTWNRISKMLNVFKKKEQNISPAIITEKKPNYDELISALNEIAAGKYQNFRCNDPDLRAILQLFADKIEKEFYSISESTVSLSIGMNESVIAGAEVSKSSKDISERMNGIAGATEELNYSVNSITSSTEDVANETSNMNNIVRENMNVTNTAAQEMDKVTKSVSEATTRLESLKKASEDITNVVGFISDMAEQTNLLALNATIEAARAGDAGKGFAVVAHEVKQLATETSENTQKIIDSIKNLNQEINEINQTVEKVVQTTQSSTKSINESNDGMQNILTVASTINQKTESIKSTLNEQKQASDEITKLISDVTKATETNLENSNKTLDAMDQAESVITAQIQNYAAKEIKNIAVLLAKSDHIIWKKRLANMMVGRESLNPNELADHHSCRLGKWYDAINDETIKSNTAYENLIEPHKKVHKHGIEAAKKYNAHDLNGALEEIQKVETSSVEVIKLLDELLSSMK